MNTGPDACFRNIFPREITGAFFTPVYCSLRRSRFQLVASYSSPAHASLPRVISCLLAHLEHPSVCFDWELALRLLGKNRRCVISYRDLPSMSCLFGRTSEAFGTHMTPTHDIESLPLTSSNERGLQQSLAVSAQFPACAFLAWEQLAMRGKRLLRIWSIPRTKEGA